MRTQAIYIPEKDRWISILELNENEKLLKYIFGALFVFFYSRF